MPDAKLATVQLTAATLRLHLAPVAPSDALLAMKTPAFYKAKALPFQLRSHGVTETELRDEFEDGIEYKRSGEGKLAIEVGRADRGWRGTSTESERRRPNLDERYHLFLCAISHDKPFSSATP